MSRRNFTRNQKEQIAERSKNANGEICCETTPTVLHQLLTYNPHTGEFKRKISLDGKQHNVVGSVTSHGYIVIGVNRESHYAHRIAWAMTYGEWPSAYIDHINQVKSDNRIENLRLATNGENMINSPARCNSKSGVRGVHRRGKNSWAAQLTVNGKCRHLGTFKSVDDAKAAYDCAARSAFGEFFNET